MNKKNDAGEGLKRIILVQSLRAQSWEAKADSLLTEGESISAVYLYEEKTDARPQITLAFRPVTRTRNAEFDSISFVILDKEEIKLYARPIISNSPQKDSTSTADLYPGYIIPENLWISMMHARELFYRVNRGEQAIDLVPEQFEKEELDKFLEMAIKQRDARFPAIPEGQVKW